MKLFDQKIAVLKQLTKKHWEKIVRSISFSNTIVHCTLYIILAITSAHMAAYLSLLLLMAIEFYIFYFTFYFQKEELFL